MAEWLSLIVNAIIACSAAGAAVIGAKGLRTWQHELRGRAEYDTSRRTLRAVYGVRDAIEHVRNPNMHPTEWADRPGRDPNADVSDTADHTYAYEKRWERVRAALSELDVELLEAEVLWGDLLKEATLELRRCTSKLFVNLRRYLRSERDRDYDSTLTPEKRNTIEEIIWPMADDPEDDKFWNSVRSAVAKFEDKLRGKRR